MTERISKQKTSRPDIAASSGGRMTIVGEILPRGGPRETKVMPGVAAPEPKVAAPEPSGQFGEGDTRRILGVLITYTWRPEGELFPVREGKNFIGRGKISSDASHRSCDVQVPQDSRMSGEHALILCRHGRHDIIDQMSSNGTFLNGELLISNQSTELPSYAEIQTGSTVWTFVKIEAPHVSDEVPPPTGRKDEPPKEEKPRGKTIVR